MKHVKTTVLMSLLFGVFGSTNALANPQQVDSLSGLEIMIKVLDNHAAANGVQCAELGADWDSCNRVLFTLQNDAKPVEGKDWALYFHSPRQVLKVENEEFKITHQTGDLYKLEPTASFSGIKPGQTIEIPVIFEYWQIARGDFLPRWYATSGNAAPKVVKSTDTNDLTQFVAPITGDQWKRTPTDNNVLMTPVSRFAKNAQNADAKPLPKAALRGQIIPSPKQITLRPQDIDLRQGVALDLAALDSASAKIVRERFTALGIALKASGYPINTKIQPATFSGKDAVAGAYRLTTTKKNAEIVGVDQAGVFHAMQSILSLIPVSGEKKIAAMEVADAPRFAFRAIHLDVARNFHSKATVLRLLDQMAAYKLNKFHFHISDDEGWRIEIPGLPELTTIGAKRCHDLTETRCLLPQYGSGSDVYEGFFSR